MVSFDPPFEGGGGNPRSVNYYVFNEGNRGARARRFFGRPLRAY